MEAIIISSNARFPTTARSTSAITCLLSDETLEMSVTIYSNEKNSHSVTEKIFKSLSLRVSVANDHFPLVIQENLLHPQHRDQAE